MKQFIKKIPILGWFLRWSYNLLRLNNIKYSVFRHQQSIEVLHGHLEMQGKHLQAQQARIDEQQSKIDEQQSKIDEQQGSIAGLQELIQEQQTHINEQEFKINSLRDSINSEVAKQISYQSVSFQQRIDQFIFDAKIDLKNEKL